MLHYQKGIIWLSISSLLVLLLACQETPQEVAEQPFPELLDARITYVANQAKFLDQQCADTLFPRTVENGSMECSGSKWWTSGFFIGTLWQLYEATGDEFFKERALERSAPLEVEQFSTFDHDLGFKLYNSYGNGLRLTGDSSYFVPILIQGAKSLITRYDKKVGAIMSWNPRPEKGWEYPVIIDNMMNLEYLFWTSSVTGDPIYADIAIEHAQKTLDHHFRDDFSSYHVVSYKAATGEVDVKNTAQGFADESAWSRGQAWGLYGYTMMYRETQNPVYLKQAVGIADFLLNHPNLPEDGVPYWDFDTPDSLKVYRDASAAAITASALTELSTFTSAEKKDQYLNSAKHMIRSLSSPAYLAAEGENKGFFLMHNVGSIPHGGEIDVPLSYADYYYLEALIRLRKLSDGSTLTLN